MKPRHVIPFAFAFFCWVDHVAAQPVEICPGGSARQTSGTPANPGSNAGSFTNFISGNTICAARGSDRWQEQHRAGNQLWDYKQGSPHPTDPTTQVGTWSASNGSNVTVTHTYSVSGSYTWAVCRNTTAGEASTYTLVSTSGNGGAPIGNVRILTGSVACP